MYHADLLLLDNTQRNQNGTHFNFVVFNYFWTNESTIKIAKAFALAVLIFGYQWIFK